MSKQEHLFEIDNLLNNISVSETLKELFYNRINELNISKTNAEKLLKIERTSLNGILECNQKRIDFNNLIKLASFLQMPVETIVQLYVSQLQKKSSKKEGDIAPEKIKFLKENFDLVVLRKAGLINSITNFKEIEQKIISYFGIKTIFEYTKPKFDIAYSKSELQPKTEKSRVSVELTRAFWIQSAKYYCEEMSNSYEYDREALINYFPEIGGYSLNEDFGLLNVIKRLYKMGVTVIYQAPFRNSLHLRGATFAVNSKPCIVLTNYKGYYATLWHALIHELYHVLYDWDDIKEKRYHLSVLANPKYEVEYLSGGELEVIEEISELEKDKKADKFARAYLFSKEKSMKIQPFLRDKKKVREYAKSHHVHPSIIYAYYAYEIKHSSAWSLVKECNPNFDKLLKTLSNSWQTPKPIPEHVNYLKGILYN